MNFRIWFENYHRNKNNCPYWGDCGSGVLPFAVDTAKFLVSHRGQDVNEGGTYGIFGGGIFLDETPYKTIEELAKSNYPKTNALKELKEETGYSGKMTLQEIYVYKDDKVNAQGMPCNFHYWNYVGICPEEFPVQPHYHNTWEEGGNSGWLALNELLSVTPMHFGLKSLLSVTGSKLSQLVKQYGHPSVQ